MHQEDTLKSTTIITIDGNTGSGKTGLAKALSSVLDYKVLEVGYIFRYIAVNCPDFDPLNPRSVAALENVTLQDLTDPKLFGSQVRILTNELADDPRVKRLIAQTVNRIAQDERQLIVVGRDTGWMIKTSNVIRLCLTVKPEIGLYRKTEFSEMRGESILQADKDFREIMGGDTGRFVPHHAALKIDTSYQTENEVTSRALMHIADKLRNIWHTDKAVPGRA